MKKSILALAVATASMAGVAQADQTTLYGSVRMAVQIDKQDTDVKKVNKIFSLSKTSTTIGNAGSRWGIKGSHDLGNGLKSIYRFEWAVKANSASANQTGRLGWVGLQGSFGTIKLGRQWTGYYGVAGYNDLFNNVFYDDYQGIFRTGNAFGYTSPDMGGFKVQAAIQADGVGGNDKHFDSYNISAMYDNAGVFAGLSYYATHRAPTDKTKKVLAAALGYSNDMFRIGLVAEQNRSNSGRKPLHLSLGGEYYISDMDTIRAGVSFADYKQKGRKKALGAAIGYQHKFSKRTRVWAEYGYHDAGYRGDAAKKSSRLSLGLRTDF